MAVTSRTGGSTGELRASSRPTAAAGPSGRSRCLIARRASRLCLAGTSLPCPFLHSFLGRAGKGEQAGALLESFDLVRYGRFQHDQISGPETLHTRAGPKGHRAGEDVEGQRPGGPMLGEPGSFAEQHQDQAEAGLLGQGDRIASSLAPGGLLPELLQLLAEPQLKERRLDRSIRSRLPLVTHER